MGLCTGVGMHVVGGPAPPSRAAGGPASADIEAGTPASAPGKGTKIKVSTTDEEDLSKALYGVHMGELFAERIHSGMETRAVLAMRPRES